MEMKIIIINIYSPLCNSEDEKDIELTQLYKGSAAGPKMMPSAHKSFIVL